MRALTLEQMEEIEGGFDWDRAASVAGGVLLIAGLSVNPTTTWAAAVYVGTAIAGPTAAGIGIGTACSS